MMIRRARGFTLIELLVAITVLAIVAVLAWRGLDSIIRAREVLTSELERTRGLQLAFAQMQSDSSNIAVAADIGGRPTIATQAGRMAMVRMVYAENQPSRVQVVTYRVQNGVLQRRESIPTRDLAALDAAWMAATSDRETAVPVVLHESIDSMTVRAWSDNGGWRTGADVPPTIPAATLAPGRPVTATQTGPSGIEVSLQLRGRPATLVKVFLLGPA